MAAKNFVVVDDDYAYDCKTYPTLIEEVLVVRKVTPPQAAQGCPHGYGCDGCRCKMREEIRAYNNK